MSRESAGLDSNATRDSRAMRCAVRPWGKSESRELRDRARRCGADFQVKSTTIARCPTRTKLARGLFGRSNSVLDRGAKAHCINRARRFQVARQTLATRLAASAPNNMKQPFDAAAPAAARAVAATA
jgi:hypothetical protein